MRSTNQVTLVGNIGRDPEMKYAKNGNAICNFSMATTESWKQGDEWKEKTEWHNIVAYSKTAEAVGQIAEKGNRCIVVGKIQTRQWEDKNGEKRYTTEIVANEFALLVTEPSSGKPRASAPAPAVPDDDDLPF